MGRRALLETYLYGEGQPNDKDLNLRGQLYQVSDGAGRLTHIAYDFKGNVLETTRQLLDDPTVGDVDWSSSLGLSSEVFTTYATYDALSRLVDTKDPGGNMQEYTYDRGGYLKTVLLNGAAYVQDIHYDAKGQRQAIWYGNGTKTSYAYEAATFRLRRLLTVNLATNTVVQDLSYWYDPVGNITRISDDAQQTLFYANQLVSPEQDFTYDALYRLIEASGREQINSAAMGMDDNWDDRMYLVPLGADAAQNYTQYYLYDAVGNILELKHSADVGSYTRSYGYGTSNNRLVTTEVGGTVYTYGHDARGNMTAMPHLQGMDWGIQNQLSGVVAGSVPAYYQYSSGERVRKYTQKDGVKEERIYLGSYEVYRKYVGGVLDLERTTVHVSDDTGRVAMLETRTAGSDDCPEKLTRYIYSNHLQSATLELDEAGHVISYEEYHPYGTTAFQAMDYNITAVAKRYRFSGKERDEESGLYYHGARYYAPWLGRWTAVDPLEAEYAPLSPYNYCFNNPVNFTDGSGMGPEEETVRGLGSKENPITLAGPTIRAKAPSNTADNTTVQQINPARLQEDLKVSQQVRAGWILPPQQEIRPDYSRTIWASEGGFAQAKQSIEQTAMFLPFASLGLKKLSNEEITKADYILEAIGFIPIGRLVGGAGKLIKYAFELSSEVSHLVGASYKMVDEAGIAGREIISVTKSGTRVDAFKVTSSIVGDLGVDAKPLMGKSTKNFPDADKLVVGRQSADGTRSWRIDFDDVKGAHYNWKIGKQSGAVPFDATKETVDNFKQQFTKNH